MTIKEIVEENKDELDDIFVHLRIQKSDEDDPMYETLWEGMLESIPTKYLECEIQAIKRSLRDAEQGINGHYIII